MIYILKANVYTKIGVTDVSIEKRITQLQTGNPFKIEKVYAQNSINSKSCYEMEKYLHRKFMNKRLYGEWFVLSDSEIKSAIRYIKNKISYLKKRKTTGISTAETGRRVKEMKRIAEENKEKLKELGISEKAVKRFIRSSKYDY